MATDTPPPAATSRRELRERERATATRPPRRAAPPRPQRVAPPSRGRGPRRTLGSRLLSFAALVVAAALAVGMSVPANALDVFAPSQSADTAELASAVEREGQALAVRAGDDDAAAARDDFEVKSWAQVLREKYSRGNFAYSVTWTGPIRWPFPYEVPITDGYGPRPAPCAGCSTFHYAIDLVPGAGTPIYAIADGVVIEHQDGHGSWGNYVRIQHTIGGRTVISSYAHMQTGSSPLAVGERISVGDFVGLVGATGQVTAPHLHLEIEDDGVRMDPFIWLTQNTTR